MGPTKRKTRTCSLPAAKKPKIAALEATDSIHHHFDTEVKALERNILESKLNSNDLKKLFDLLAEQDVSRLSTVASALCRVFYQLIVRDSLLEAQNASKKDALVSRWLYEQFQKFLQFLSRWMRSSDDVLSPKGLDTRMLLLEAKAVALRGQNESFWARDDLQNIVVDILESHSGSHIIEYFTERYGSKYVDVRNHTFRSVRLLAAEGLRPSHFEGTVTLLNALQSMPLEKSGIRYFISNPLGSSTARHVVESARKLAGDAWIAVLNGDMSMPQRKTILGLIPRQIVRCIDRPELLSDFLDDSFNMGGSTSLMALSGLYQLIQEKNLDYPNFYGKLYSLVSPSTMHSKHRSRFLRSLETFLSSTHLPANIVASFIKRLSRLALYSPPSAIVAIVPFVYNLLKTHASCTFMLHRIQTRTARTECAIMTKAEDPFQMSEGDPRSTNAIDSSLWELETLQSHYHPNVATICNIVSQQFTKQAYSLEDFLDHSYTSMVESELSRDLKKSPVVEFQIPHKIFCQEGGNLLSATTKLWQFGT